MAQNESASDSLSQRVHRLNSPPQDCLRPAFLGSLLGGGSHRLHRDGIAIRCVRDFGLFPSQLVEFVQRGLIRRVDGGHFVIDHQSILSALLHASTNAVCGAIFPSVCFAPHMASLTFPVRVWLLLVAMPGTTVNPVLNTTVAIQTCNIRKRDIRPTHCFHVSMLSGRCFRGKGPRWLQLNPILCESSFEHAFAPRLASPDALRPASGRRSVASLP